MHKERIMESLPSEVLMMIGYYQEPEVWVLYMKHEKGKRRLNKGIPVFISSVSDTFIHNGSFKMTIIKYINSIKMNYRMDGFALWFRTFLIGDFINTLKLDVDKEKYRKFIINGYEFKHCINGYSRFKRNQANKRYKVDDDFDYRRCKIYMDVHENFMPIRDLDWLKNNIDSLFEEIINRPEVTQSAIQNAMYFVAKDIFCTTVQIKKIKLGSWLSNDSTLDTDDFHDFDPHYDDECSCDEIDEISDDDSEGYITLSDLEE